MLLHYDGDQTPSHRIRFVSFFLSSDSSCAYLEEKIYYLLLKIIASPPAKGAFSCDIQYVYKGTSFIVSLSCFLFFGLGLTLQPGGGVAKGTDGCNKKLASSGSS
uniref:Uncharacterized protein n=1 Tax=Bionectria ochroleuca TaxID=29856 RepID=A0A8H7N5V1_BIOOC